MACFIKQVIDADVLSRGEVYLIPLSDDQYGPALLVL